LSWPNLLRETAENRPIDLTGEGQGIFDLFTRGFLNIAWVPEYPSIGSQALGTSARRLDREVE
jgi:hypothetical protein